MRFLTFKLLTLFHYLVSKSISFQLSNFKFQLFWLFTCNSQLFIFSSYLTIWILSDLWFSTIKFLWPYLIGAQVSHYSCIKYFQFSSFSSSGYVVIYFSTFILKLYHYFVSTRYVFNSQASLVVSYSSFSLRGYEHFLVLKFQLMCLSTYGCQFSSFCYDIYITLMIFKILILSSYPFNINFHHLRYHQKIDVNEHSWYECKKKLNSHSHQPSIH